VPVCVFLGAGFSRIGGIPLASQLFDVKPVVDRITSQRLVERVSADWSAWHSATQRTPEEYLAHLQSVGSQKWSDAQWYVGLAVTIPLARVEVVGLKATITRHYINRTTQLPTHEKFWTAIFKRTQAVTVITTNYDILIERGLRHQLRPRISRPGFHYGDGAENLAGGGYPSYSHIQKISINGSVPLLKLHGSASWSVRNDTLIHYHDCRPAIRGDAAIIAPVTQKTLPTYLQGTWDRARAALMSSRLWIIVGYSLPAYDEMVRDLLKQSAVLSPDIHVFDPDTSVADRYKALLPGCRIAAHTGLPDGIANLTAILANE
jgi:SIR2-like domain